MALILGGNQSVKVTTKYLNDVNDPAPGQVLTSPSGSIVQAYGGQVGGYLTLSTADALALSDTAVGTLYGGVYRYVQLLSSSTATPARGNLCFYSSAANIGSAIVTADVTAATLGLCAGVFINTITKGNYGFIQVWGLASVLFKSSVTDTTAGDLCIVDQTPTFAGDGLADGTTVTDKVAKSIIGVCIGAPANSTISTVSLFNRMFF